MSTKLDELIEKILDESIKVVSFDIFDTLLVRPTISPTDLFKIIGMRAGYKPAVFKEMRITAEREARKKKPFNVDDISINDIYNQMSMIFSLSLDEITRLLNIEMDVEEAYLYPRYSIQSIFQQALDAGKEVIIVSDMYLPKFFVEKVLQKNGYNGYSHLYLSCEYGKAKGTGNLYQQIVMDYSLRGILASEIIHIGDNQSADVRQARNNGLKAEHIPSTISIFKSKKEWNRLILNNHNETDNTFLIGYLANMIFDDPFYPFASYSLLNGDVSNIAYLVSPLFLSATKWLLEDAIENKADLLLLTYRDGYLPEKILQSLFKYYHTHIDLQPIYLSRKIRYIFKGNKKNGLFSSILELPVNSKMSVLSFIEKRLLITDTLDSDYALSIFLKHGYGSGQDAIGDRERYLYFLNELEPLFQKYANPKAKIITDYCYKCIGNHKIIASFDIGYRGSVHKFLSQEIGIKNLGYHLLSTPLLDIACSERDNMKSYIKYGFDIPFETKILHALLEDIISLQEGSAIDILKDGESYVVVKEQFSNSDSIKSIQKKILAYANGFINLFQYDISLLHFDHYLNFELLTHFLKHPCEKDAAALLNLQFKDSEFITNNSDLYNQWYFSHFKRKMLIPNVEKKIGLKSSIYNYLDRVHLLPYAKKMYYPIRDLIKKRNHTYPCLDQYTAIVEAEVGELRKSELLSMRKNICIIGDMVSFDKGICSYLNNLSNFLWNEGYNLILLSEATLAPDTVMQKRISFYAKKVPDLFGKNQYQAEKYIEIPNEVKHHICINTYLNWAKENWLKRHKNMTESYAEMLCYCAQKYYSEVFELLKPTGIIMWNQFHALHHIVEGIAKENNIPITYMEFGSLPGTIALENLGQMGESYPSINFETFRDLSVDGYELEQADNIWSYLKNSKLNRNIQKSSDAAKSILDKVDRSRPTIFVAGQNDFESGLQPYTLHTQKYHSPIFKSSDEVTQYLSELAIKNNWNLIYKPHPIMSMLGSSPESMPNTIIIKDIDINEIIDFSDVTITILSQTGYIALIREKPTVMLGYTQLRGKGCTYEAFSLDKVESEIKHAIESGFTQEQKEAFKRHIAQMIKYYLYDDMLERDIRYGKSAEEAEKLILQNINSSNLY